MNAESNAAGRVAAHLRDELLSGSHRPGERLREEELAARFGTGRYTVRAALRSLVASGLLDHRPNRGAIVPLLSRERVDELYDHREVLEIGALRLAQRHGADLGRVAEATHALQALPDDASWVEVIVTHQRIHHELVVAAANSKLLQAYTQCEEELHYVVSTVRPDFTASRLAQLHTTLLAELQRGGAAAIAALEYDLQIGRSAVLDALPGRHEEAS
ncbi:GntR family transcriptional regulator [Nocardia sp. R7R-8]|uniref:GntR family transcriptional regulator n=1 Tax=Nocardia sp. R7R-8 TaxID=3459304 RepID=UPI00403E1E1A